MSRPLTETAYHQYLRDPVRFGHRIENRFDTSNSEGFQIDFPLDGETSWSELLNPFADREARSYRKVGGFVRHGADPMEESELEELFDLAPFPGGQEYAKLSWGHLDTLPVGGRALYGNFVGPGADAIYFARPTGMLDLIAKIHDFAYEINGLHYKPRSQPAAFWSRLAKADWIFVQMLEATGRDDLIYWFAKVFAECKFRGDPELFRADDRFINPIQALPKNWLMVPPDFLPEVPKVSVKGKKTGGRRTAIVRPLLDPYQATESDQPDLWIDLVADQIPSDLTLALASLDGHFPTAADLHSACLIELLGNPGSWKSLNINAWQEEIPLSRMGE